MIGAKPEEIAVTTGASAGAAVVAYGLEWKRGDEIITVQREFPLQYATWKPMEEREGVRLRVIAPRDRFITADDLIDALAPKTRIVSVSLVRYDDGSLLDAARLAAACHAQGALLLLDVSQACGAVPMNVNDLGADFMVCAGYKWLLSCYGTGFFWVKSEHLDRLRPSARYKTGLDPYLNVFTAQAILLTNQQAVITLRVQQMASSVQLIEALGGGWNAAQLPSERAVSSTKLP